MQHHTFLARQMILCEFEIGSNLLEVSILQTSPEIQVFPQKFNTNIQVNMPKISYKTEVKRLRKIRNLKPDCIISVGQ